MDMLMKNYNKFEKDMAAFTFGQHQDFENYIDRLKATGWTVEDALAWIEQKKKTISETMREAKAVTCKCPNCHSPMQSLSVNINPATQTNDNSKSVWLCTNQKCMDTIYNTESVEEILKKKGKYKEK